MATSYDRLSAQDQSFLLFEGPGTPMNVGGTSIFSGGRLLKRGEVDLPLLKAHLASRLHLVPRYRQRLAYIPFENQPVWIDCERFDLDYHVHHLALPRSGNEDDLKRLSADILSKPLDRTKPLWEMWVIEGLDGGRFATVTKAHHCMIDGVSGVDLAAVMMRSSPDTRIGPTPRWRPRPAPSGFEMLRDDLLRRARLPVIAPVRGRPGDVLRSDLGQRLNAVWGTVRSGLRGAADTPLNQPIGPSRRFDWFRMDFASVRRLKNALDVTVNDIVLATVAGAVRRFLKRRGESLSGLDFRVAIPVNVRPAGDHTLGNRVSVWLTGLPVGEPNATRRLAAVHASTSALKSGRAALGADAVMKVLEWTGSALVSIGVRFANRLSPYNLIVTNVPGPPFPLYLLGARLLAAYPLVPLFENQGLGIALFSYDGGLFWGFNADWDLLPDLADLVSDVEVSFAELEATAQRMRREPAARRRLQRGRAVG